MSFWRRIVRGGRPGEDGTAPEGIGDEHDAAGLLVASEASFDAHAGRHRVTVWLRLADPDFANEREQQRIFRLEDQVMRRLDEAAVGEHDTNSLEPGYFAMRLIGDDADAIVAAITPLLMGAPVGSYLAVRRGPAGSGEDRLEIEESAAPPS